MSATAAIGVLPTRALCQNQPSPAPPAQTDEQQAARQEMQQLILQMVANMAAQGINPQEFFQQISQQMQDGTLDMAGLQKQLVDRGLLDQKSIDRVQSTVQRSALSGIKRRLEATDEEWAVILPKLQKVLAATAALGPAAGRPTPMAAFAGQGQSGDLTKAMTELRAAVKDSTSPPPLIAAKLQAVRDARQKAATALAAARAELIEVLTHRQEALLTHMGLIQ